LGFDYRVIKAPGEFAMIFRNKKLLIRVEDQELKHKINLDSSDA